MMKVLDLRRIPVWISGIGFILFIICGLYYKMDYTMYFLSKANSAYSVIYIFRLLSGVAGILTFFGLGRLCEEHDRIAHKLSTIGGMTLPIYFIHLFIFQVLTKVHLNSSNLMIIIVASVLMIYVSIFLYRLLVKNRFCALFLFGKKI